MEDELGNEFNFRYMRRSLIWAYAILAIIFTFQSFQMPNIWFGLLVFLCALVNGSSAVKVYKMKWVEDV